MGGGGGGGGGGGYVVIHWSQITSANAYSGTPFITNTWFSSITNNTMDLQIELHVASFSPLMPVKVTIVPLLSVLAALHYHL